MSSTSFARWVAPVLLPVVVGCVGSRGDTDLLEARLRDQQDMVARYEKLLDTNQTELTLARKEADLLRTQIVASNGAPLLPEHADVLLRAEQLAFHQMMTGTRDIDGRPGDEALNVVLMPQTKDGETIRLVGDLEVEALDLSRPEGQQQIGAWKYTSEQARELWHSGFLASGFQIDVPWDARTAGPDVLLHARLKTPDGRQFDASHQVRVDQPVMQTAAALPAAAPQIEPRRMAPVPPAQPIDVSLSPAVPPAVTAGLAPLDRPMAAPEFPSSDAVDMASTGETGGVSPRTETVAAPNRQEPDGRRLAGSTPAPFPTEPGTAPSTSSDTAPVPFAPKLAPTVDQPPPFDRPLPQVVARPVPASAANDPAIESAPPVAARSPERLDSVIPPDVPMMATPADLTPPAFPDAQAPSGIATPPATATPANGVTIQPLAPPQRYRRTGERSELVPPPAAVPPVTPVEATPFRAPATQAAPLPVPTTTPASTTPEPFPVDVTEPPARPVIQSSVNWTDESIPYLR
jgi:hypothetical protein